VSKPAVAPLPTSGTMAAVAFQSLLSTLMKGMTRLTTSSGINIMALAMLSVPASLQSRKEYSWLLPQPGIFPNELAGWFRGAQGR